MIYFISDNSKKLYEYAKIWLEFYIALPGYVIDNLLKSYCRNFQNLGVLEFKDNDYTSIVIVDNVANPEDIGWLNTVFIDMDLTEEQEAEIDKYLNGHVVTKRYF